MTDTLPPHSIEAEQGVLGCIMLAPDAYDDCAAKFKSGSKVFYDARHRKTYEIIGQMRLASEAIDLLTVQQKLKDLNLLEAVGGLSYLSSLPDKVPSAANVSYYIEIVKEKHSLRRIVQTCTRAVQKIYESNEPAASVLGQIQNGFSILETDDAEIVSQAQSAERLTSELEKRFNLHNEGRRSGLLTGIIDFDAITDGLQLCEQTIIAARPSIGKTALATTIVDRVCLEDLVPTVFVTFEMSPEGLLKRLLSTHSRIEMGKIKSGAFTQSDFPKFTAFVGLLKSRPLHLVNAVAGMTIDQVAACIRRLCRKHAIKLVIIDYLQKIRAAGRHEKKTYEIAEVSGVLKSLAVETGAAFVTIASLNRESEKEKGRLPRISDLAHSGQIEFDADTIALLHRERTAEQANEAKLIIGKQRDGELGVVDLTFRGEYCRFENHSRFHEQFPARAQSADQ